MKKFLFVLLACMSATVLAKGKEQLSFKCTLKNGAVVTVHRTQSDYIYRYTKNGKVEKEIQQPKYIVAKRSVYYSGADGGSNTFTEALHFKNGTYGYTVHTDDALYALEDGSEDKTKYSNGIWIENNSIKKDYFLKCKKVQRDLFYDWLKRDW